MCEVFELDLFKLLALNLKNKNDSLTDFAESSNVGRYIYWSHVSEKLCSERMCSLTVELICFSYSVCENKHKN